MDEGMYVERDNIAPVEYVLLFRDAGEWKMGIWAETSSCVIDLVAAGGSIDDWGQRAMNPDGAWGTRKRKPGAMT